MKLVCLAFLLVTPAVAVHAHAASDEHIGEGQARVIGGNLVSARKRALGNARRDAVVHAVTAMLEPQQLAAVSAALEEAIYRRSARYVRRYRVLEEAQEGVVFRIKVAVSLNVKRLLRDLKRVVDRYGSGGGGTASRLAIRPSLKVKGGESSIAKQLARYARQELQQGGYATTEPAKLELSGVVTISKSAPVRGLQLPAASADLSLTLRQLSDNTVLTSVRTKGWGVARSRAEAEQQAAHRSLVQALPRALQELRKRWPVFAVAKDELMLRVSGLSTLGQHREIERVLSEKIGGVRWCRLRRINKGEVWYVLRTAAGVRPRALSQALTAYLFGSFKLSAKRTEGGFIWLIVEAREPEKPAREAGPKA
jgi:hypothetical protein